MLQQTVIFSVQKHERYPVKKLKQLADYKHPPLGQAKAINYSYHSNPDRIKFKSAQQKQEIKWLTLF